MKVKKILVAAISFVLVAVLALAGTLAYLTSTDEDVNVMTMPGIEIEQLEYERVVDENGEWVESDYTGYGYTADLMQPFTQGKELYPAVYQDGDVKWDDRNDGDHQQPWSQIGAPGSNQLFDDSVKNVIDKFVFVKNTGKSDAYYRTFIAIEIPEDVDANLVHYNINNNSRFDWEELDYAVIDGVRYYVIVATYNEILTPGEVSRPSLLQVYLDPAVTMADVEEFGEYMNVLAFSQAVQTVGFDSADAALDAAFGYATIDNLPWNNDVAAAVATADELVSALEAGEDVVLVNSIKIDPASMSNAYGTTGINVKNGQTIDGGNHTIDIKGAGGTWDSGINTTGGIIKNVTVTGSFRGIFINHNSDHSERVILENVTTTGTVYTISCDQGMNQGLTATDCEFYGWTSYAATLGDAEFINCTFGEGSGYAFMRPYAPTTFVGCDFEEGFEMDPRAAVTFENCTIGGKPLTAENLATLVTSNLANATVK